MRKVLGEIMAGRGDRVPVSALPNDGTFPTGTTQFEKRNLATEVPVWEPEVCIQCGKCVLVCPHAVIRSKVYEAAVLANAPPTFKSRSARLPEWKGLEYTLQVAVEDCTGCGDLRRRLPGAQQIGSAAESDQHAAAIAAARKRARELGFLPFDSGP